MDWNQPYSCEGWASEFQQTLPILDDGSGANIYGLFGSGYVPHSAVIAGDGLVIYSQSGFNYNTMISIIEYGLSTLVLDADEDGIMDDVDNCMDDYNPNQVDTDEDGTGDLCDDCNNLIFTDGDINGDLSLNVLDILGMVDIILGEVESPCGYEASDMNMDGHVNILDVIRIVQLLINGTEQQAIIFLDDILTPIKFTKLIHELPTNYFVSNEIIVWPNPFNNSLSINGSGHTEIYNLMGKKIKQINLNGTFRWNTSDLSSGIYKIINNKKTTTITLVK